MSLQHIRNIKIKNVRGFAAAAAAKPIPEISSSPTSQFVPREDIKTTVVNNVVVSSVENNKPLARVSVFYKVGGSTYKHTVNQGILNVLKSGVLSRFVHSSTACEKKPALETAVTVFEKQNLATLIDMPVKSAAEVSRHHIIKWIADNYDKVEDPGVTLDWKAIMQQASEINSLITESSFGGIFLSLCAVCKENTFPLALAYVRRTPKPNIVELASLMKLCGDYMDQVSEEFVLDLYEKIKKRSHGIWESEMADKVIYGLLRTHKWKDSIDIINSIEYGSHLKSLQDVVCTAFERKEYEIGWSLVEPVKGKPFYRLKPPFCHYWLKNCPQTEESLRGLLDYCDETENHLTEGSMKSIRHYLQNVLNYTGRPTIINEYTGECKNCKSQLEKAELTKQEFETLTQEFFTKVLVQNNIFINSTPEEFRRYKDFIKKYGPFDYVIDGLNMAYASTEVVIYRRPRPNPKILEQAVIQFAKERKRILVIGRSHMKRWPSTHIIQQHSSLFLLDDKSMDDPFSIYAVLKSGPHCNLLSMDFLRNHTFRLQDRAITKLFKRWRWTRQLKFSWDNRLRYMNTAPFGPLYPVPQKNPVTGIYHIPYEIQELESPYDIPTRWMCFTPNTE